MVHFAVLMVSFSICRVHSCWSVYQSIAIRSLAKPGECLVLYCSGECILYHEPCAVYSNGTGQIPMGGMEDDQVLRFYEHGERCMGKGLKCCLCGQK